MRLRTFALSFAALSLALGPACASREPEPRAVTVAPPTADADQPVDYAGVHHVVAYGSGIYSGAVPEGDAGFETLANMGIRTIISVDGAAPEAEEAAEHGLRYVHLPVTYGGIPEERRLELARAVRDLPGPVYIHCHHGKHRSAGAASAAAVQLGRLTNEQATARMKVSGTAPDYTGLYACASDSRPRTDAEISQASDEFPSRWRTSGMVDAMVAIDEASDQLKAIEKAGWNVPANHPDLVPTAVAGNLENLLRALMQDHDSLSKPQEFRDMLKDSAEAALALENGIASKAAVDELSKRMKTLTASCKKCHADFRD